MNEEKFIRGGKAFAPTHNFLGIGKYSKMRGLTKDTKILFVNLYFFPSSVRQFLAGLEKKTSR